jgi:coenzyme Q-binding protein COQ10
MSHAKAEIEIEAPIRTVYDVITDFEAYPEFLSETKKVEILKETSKSATVTFRIALIRKINYTLEIKLTPPKGLTWKLVEGDLMKKNSGKWKLIEKKGITKAVYEIDMEFAGLVPKAVSNKLIGSSLPTMMKSFRDRAEEMV